MGIFTPQCLIDTQLLTTLCVPPSVWIGLALGIIGVAVATFVPFGRKIGGGLFLAGAGLALVPYILSSLWETTWFKVSVIGLGMFIVILLVLFSGEDKNPVKKK